MERLPLDYYPFPLPPILSATSVSDVLNSREIVRAANEEQTLQGLQKTINYIEADPVLSRFLKISKLLGGFLGKISAGSPAEEEIQYRGLVLLPVVRHFPNQDTRENALFVQDPTGILELHLPDLLQQAMLNRIIKQTPHTPIDYPSIRSRSWCSDILILSSYTDILKRRDRLVNTITSKGENQTLLYVFNRLATQQDPESLSFISKLAAVYVK